MAEHACSHCDWESKYVQLRNVKTKRTQYYEKTLDEQYAANRQLQQKIKLLEIAHLNDMLSQAQKIKELNDKLQRALATNREIEARLKSYRIPTGVPMHLKYLIQ